MKHMAKRILMMAGLVLAFVLSFSITSYAYTEEEIAQAKAWLSAHGYSPDYGGAAQAYQDYLDGKFDEELGIAATQEAETQEAETQETTEKVTEETVHPKKEKPGKTDPSEKGNFSGEKRQLQGDGEPGQPAEDNDAEKASSDLAAAKNAAGQPDKKVKSRMVSDSDGYYISTIASGIHDRKNEKAVIVVAIGVFLMFMAEGMIHVFRNHGKKEKSMSIVEKLDLD